MPLNVLVNCGLVALMALRFFPTVIIIIIIIPLPLREGLLDKLC